MEVSERGFVHGSEIPSGYGGYIKAYESSAARAPHIWVLIESPVDLNVPEGAQQECVVHLSIPNATRLRDELTYLIDSADDVEAFDAEAEDADE